MTQQIWWLVYKEQYLSILLPPKAKVFYMSTIIKAICKRGLFTKYAGPIRFVFACICLCTLFGSGHWQICAFRRINVANFNKKTMVWLNKENKFNIWYLLTFNTCHIENDANSSLRRLQQTTHLMGQMLHFRYCITICFRTGELVYIQAISNYHEPEKLLEESLTCRTRR